jgi:acyl carrier protein
VTTSKEVYDKLTAVFQDVFEDETLIAKPGLTADDVAGWDSLANLRLMLTVQKAFGVRFTAHEITSLNNVGELAALVETKTLLHQ